MNININQPNLDINLEELSEFFLEMITFKNKKCNINSDEITSI